MILMMLCFAGALLCFTVGGDVAMLLGTSLLVLMVLLAGAE